ncbi:type IV pilus assembly protein FimV [Crenobacter cavernae]|nr:tetratricopeptide repeat protein [Crenobacter cavernae]
MSIFFAAFGCSFLLMVIYFTARRTWKTARYVKPRARGIDPVGEAEVFLAYGRVDEAIRVLRDTLTDEPDNLDAQITLLRAYSHQRNAQAYSGLAAQVSPKLQDRSLWHTIQQTGRELDPANPLYQQAHA